MRRTVFLVAAGLMCVLGVSAQQQNVDTQKSTLTIHVGKTGAFSGFGHEHEVSAPIHSGTADAGPNPAVEIHVNTRELRGNLTLHGQTRPITVQVTLKDGHYTGDATVKQTDFGIKPPGVSGVRAKDEIKILFDVRLV